MSSFVLWDVRAGRDEEELVEEIREDSWDVKERDVLEDISFVDFLGRGAPYRAASLADVFAWLGGMLLEGSILVSRESDDEKISG